MVSRRANEIQEAPESLEYGACEVYALPMEGARSALLQMQFVQAISFTVVIVDSYKVSREIGASMAASGLLVGIFMAGAMVGNALMTAALCLWPETWRKLQSWLQLCLCSDVLSVLSYVLLLRDLPGLGVWALRCLLLCRFCWGLGMGVAGQLASVVISQVTLPSDLPDQMQRLQFWQSLGLGVGPPVAAFGLWAAEMLPDQLGTELASSSVLILLQALVAFAVARCPAYLAASLVRTEDSYNANGGDVLRPTMLLVSCCALCALRGYAVAGAEVGTALLLEAAYGWTRRSIGMMIGWAFVASVPLRFAYVQLKYKLSTVLWIRTMSVCAICGTLFLFSSLSTGFGLNLVLANLVIFPSLYLGEGLTRGVMMQVIQQNNSLSVNAASFIAITINNLARTFAPWLARLSISTGQLQEGQNLFAFGQLTCCVLFLVAFEVGIREADVGKR